MAASIVADVDLDAVRTFVAIADAGRFQHAATELSITQQAVSKRVAALERAVGVRLFARTPRGAELTVDGRAFLPHARELLRAEARAFASVQPGHRALRVDVIGRGLAPAALLRDFHRAHPEVELDVVTLFDADAAVDAIRSGTVDASFRAVTATGGRFRDDTGPARSGSGAATGRRFRDDAVPAVSLAETGRRLPDDIEVSRAFDEPVQLLTGPAHPLAAARTVTPADLVGHRIWMPGLVPGTEWAAYYDALAAAFGLSIESTGPDFGVEPLLDTIAGSGSLATLVGEQTRLVWPAGHDLRRIAVRNPTPVYPHSLVRHRDNRHPALAALREHLDTMRPAFSDTETWTPAWA